MLIDFFPDVTEFPPSQLCATTMTIGGQPAYLYSPQTAAIVDGHFKWMQTYGLDGVLLQRFLNDIPRKISNGDTVLKNVKNGANKYGRGFAIEYDISGAPAGTMLAKIQTDWMYLVDQLKVTTEPEYFHYKDLPVVAIWGLGFNDSNHQASPAIAQSLIDWFHRGAASQYRAALIGGVPAGWRSLNKDADSDSAWKSIYDSLDIVQPWTVGRYNSMVAVDNWLISNLNPDNARTLSQGHAYQPVIFPGFSWHNLKGADPLNAIPRLSGRFIWEQAINAKRSGAPMLKIAMFDEVNEGTAMFKAAPRRSDAPDQGTWVTFDADGDTTLPSDWYLRLGGAITKMFHGSIPITASIPIKPTDPVMNAQVSEPKNVVIDVRLTRISGGILFSGIPQGLKIRIVDVHGHVHGELVPGLAGAFWDGRDETGNRLSKGVYCAQLAGKAGIAYATVARSFVWMGI